MTGTDLCVRLYKSVPVIFEPPCTLGSLLMVFVSMSMALSGLRVVVVASSTVALYVQRGSWGVMC